MPKSIGAVRTALLPLFALVVFACGPEAGPREAREAREARAPRELLLPDVEQTYAQHVPPELRMTIGVEPDLETQAPTVVIDALADRPFFPMPEEIRKFESKAQMLEFIAETFPNVERILDADGKLDGLRGTYAMRGAPRFDDRALGVQYNVREPVLAFVGGAHGLVEVAGERLCVDPDGDCTGAYASYMEPVGLPTAPSTVRRCNSANNVCVEFHTFFNKTSFPFPWARHGSNVRFVVNSAIASTRLTTSGRIHYRTGLPYPEFDALPLPSISNMGQSSIETALWCFASTTCPTYNTEAVCGYGSISDPDLFTSANTGNGPLNTTFCGP